MPLETGLDEQIRKNLPPKRESGENLLPGQIIRSVAEGVGKDLGKIRPRGDLAPIAKDIEAKVNRGYAKSGELDSARVIWALGEIGEDGIGLLHEVATSYLGGLEKEGESAEGWPILEEMDHLAGNLALRRLAELHRQGNYSSEKLAVVVEGISRVMVVGDVLAKKDPHLPVDSGLKSIWSEALEDQTVSQTAWEKTGVALDSCLIGGFEAHKNKALYLASPLLGAASWQESIPPDVEDKMVGFFLASGWFQESYGLLGPAVFLKVIEKKLDGGGWLYWYPQNVKELFSQPGVALGMMDILERKPKYFRMLTKALFRSIVWSPEEEYQQVMRRYEAVYHQKRPVLDLSDCLDYVDSWWYVQEEQARWVDWGRYILPNLAFNLRNITSREVDNVSETLPRICWIAGKIDLENLEGQARTLGIWLPVVAEDLLLLSGRGFGEISFAAGQAQEVQGRVHALKDVKEEVLTCFDKVKQLLHYSRTGEAAKIVVGLYGVWQEEERDYQGITKADLEPVFFDSAIKARMDLIEQQICPSSQQEARLKDWLGVGVSRSISLVTDQHDYEGLERRKRLEPVWAKIRQLGEAELLPGTIALMVKELKSQPDSDRGFLYPMIIAVRSVVLDQGIVWPEGDNPQAKLDWMKTLVELAGMAGEIPRNVIFAWKRASVDNHDQAARLLASAVRSDYPHLKLVEKSYRNAGYTEFEVADKYRELNSRSMLDLLFRMADEWI